MRYTLLFCLLLYVSVPVAQTCTPDEEIDKIPGKFVQQTTNEITASDCNGNAGAVKILKSIQSIIARNFFGDGSRATGFFSAGNSNYFETTFLNGYEYTIGFYQYYCNNGKLSVAHEYGTTLNVSINEPGTSGETFRSARNSDENGFDIPGTHQYIRNKIPLFRYLVFRKPEELEKINNGTGYYDGPRRPSQFYDDHPAITRYWFLTPPGKKVLVPVTRKEFLNSLLEFYEKELPQHMKRMNYLIKVDGETLGGYAREKDKDAKSLKRYEDFKKNVDKHREDSARYQEGYRIKKNKVTEMLSSNTEEWLSQPAILSHPQLSEGYCRSETLEDYLESGCYTFNNFAEPDKGLTVYKWNTEFFKTSNPCEPKVIMVSLRYKYDIPFSERIRDHYTNNLDFEALRKLLTPGK